MKALLVMLGIMLSANVLTAAKRGVPSQAEQDFNLGSVLGNCLERTCQVFRGAILTDWPVTGDSVKVHVEERLFGAVPDIVDVRYEDSLHPKNGAAKDGLGSVADVWARAGGPLSRNAPITVALRILDGDHSALPVMVASKPREIEMIRSITQEALRLTASPELLSQIIDSLSEPKPALAGYLFIRYYLGAGGLLNDLSSSLHSQLLDNPSVPPQRAADVVSQLVFRFSFLSPAGKAALIARFSDLAQRPEVELSSAGYMGLAKVLADGPSVKAMITPGTLAALESAYRGRVRKGDMARNPLLEAGLGIKY